jgi:hypothetical protein
MEIICVVPHDDALVEAEHKVIAPYGFAPTFPAVMAFRALAAAIVDLAGSTVVKASGTSPELRT